MTANDLYHKWMREWGSCIGEHEEEIVKDITDFCAEHVGIAIKNTEEALRNTKSD